MTFQRSIRELNSGLPTMEHLPTTEVLDLEDPAIFQHPILYMSEPGFWRVTPEGAQNLRPGARVKEAQSGQGRTPRSAADA